MIVRILWLIAWQGLGNHSNRAAQITDHPKAVVAKELNIDNLVTNERIVGISKEAARIESCTPSYVRSFPVMPLTQIYFTHCLYWPTFPAASSLVAWNHKSSKDTDTECLKTGGKQKLTKKGFCSCPPLKKMNLLSALTPH